MAKVLKHVLGIKVVSPSTLTTIETLHPIVEEMVNESIVTWSAKTIISFGYLNLQIISLLESLT